MRRFWKESKRAERLIQADFEASGREWDDYFEDLWEWEAAEMRAVWDETGDASDA
jgi:hypothetical protein